MWKRNMVREVVLILGLLLMAGPGRAEEKLKVGDPAPDFTLPGATKDSILASGVTLTSEIGKNNIILAFYPADWSGGCTTEMCTMRDNFAMLADFGAMVFGISGDYVYSHRAWAKSLDLPFTLLSDHTHDVAKQYDSFNATRGNNLRTLYVIDRRGKIAYVDLDYKAGSPASFTKLKAALQTLK